MVAGFDNADHTYETQPMKISRFGFPIIILSLTTIVNRTTFAQAAERGITANARWSNYYQGLISGIGSREWDCGGWFDGYAGFDTECGPCDWR